MTVYIPTRGRISNLVKIVPRWLDKDFHVVLVIEKSEYRTHRELVSSKGWDSDVEIISPIGAERGIGHARKTAVINAALRGFRSIIMSDDDMRPSLHSNMEELLYEAKNPAVLGIGAVRTLHDRFSGGVTSKHNDVILCPGGWGMQLFALNVETTSLVGNFDSRLDCWGEDHELMRNGIAAGIPWLVHCGVKCEAIGKRYAPGGLNTFIADGNRAMRERRCREIINKRWPKYTSHPEMKSRVRWQKMMDDYIPNWREKSAIHGGKLLWKDVNGVQRN